MSGMVFNVVMVITAHKVILCAIAGSGIVAAGRG